MIKMLSAIRDISQIHSGQLERVGGRGGPGSFMPVGEENQVKLPG